MVDAPARAAAFSGAHFLKGDEAAVEGAIAAGCRFYAGYPITPSSEIAERAARRLPEVGGLYVQMEDEIASLAAVIGASCGGARAMTATSGPGLSLMQENVGLAVMLEAPCVIVDVQRGGPSTGLPTLTAQGDMLAARHGSHGDYEIVAFAPSSVQDMFDHTVRAFDAAERYRTPVLVLADQVIGQMKSRLDVPEASAIRVASRPIAPPPGAASAGPNGDALVPPMKIAGAGHRVHATGLTHDARGYPATDAMAQEALVTRLVAKIRDRSRDIVDVEERDLADADVAVVTYGSTVGPAVEAVRAARAEGISAGILRLVTPWPFPGEAVARASAGVRAMVVAEGNLGQMVHPVREHARCRVAHVGLPGGRLLTPAEILRAVREAVA